MSAWTLIRSTSRAFRTDSGAARRLATLYALLATLWIACTALTRYLAMPTPAGAEIVLRNVAQDLAFMAVATLVVWAGVRHLSRDAQQTRRRLLDSESRRRLLLEHAAEGIWTLDLAGRTVALNPEMRRLLGDDAASMVGRPWTDAVHPDDLPPPPSGRVSAARYELRLAGGPGVWTRVAVSLQPTVDGGMFAFVRDLSEQVTAEQRLRDVEARYMDLFENNPEPILIVDDADHSFLAVNRAAVDHYGYTREQFAGMTLPALRGGTGPCAPQAGEFLHRRSDGRTVNVRKTVQAIEYDGRPAHLVVAVDVTDRVAAHDAVRELADTLETRVAQRTRELEELAGELEWFGAALTHDLRGPLRTVREMAFRICTSSHSQLDEQGCEDAHRLVGVSARMSALVDNLLDFSRRNPAQLPAEPVSLVLVVTEVEGIIRRELGDATLRLRVIEPLHWVRAHRATLTRAIAALLRNAAQYAAPPNSDVARPATVTISAVPDGERVSLYICDDGPGLPPAVWHRHFSPDAAALPPAGTAPAALSGLALATRAARRLGGALTYGCANAPCHGVSRGACFRLTLPRADR